MIDTRKLEAFAVQTRTELVRGTTARITAVTAAGSTARVENPGAVHVLEAQIAKLGGGKAGIGRVADQQAYVWFNRIIALRFMDANGYTSTPVVSPEHGKDSGQPAALAAAKRGEFDPAVFTKPRTVERITGLLGGSLTSHDPQGEAYGLILEAHCAYWNKVMPFMFGREGEYTNLLMPSALLAADSVLAQAVAALTTDDCQDVEVIGWLYQYYIAERKDEVFAAFKRGKKAGPEEIPAATQLFTPDWIVRYLVQNSVGRLWLLNHPDSKLIEQMEYYIQPVGDPGEFLRIAKPEELTVMDPACGSGHMLTYAFDLLYAVYEEEGYAPADIPGLILEHNLFGCEIDQRAGSLAAFTLTMKARARLRAFFRHPVQPNICVIKPISFDAGELDQLTTKDGDKQAEQEFWNAFAQADTRGSLIQVDDAVCRLASTALAAHTPPTMHGMQAMDATSIQDRARQVLDQAEYLSRQYAVVVTNPPYMGSNKVNAELSTWLKDTYPDGKQDLYGCFVLRAMTLANAHGLVGIIVGDTWMSIKTFEKLRLKLLNGHMFASFLHLRDVSNHPDIFGANAAFVLEMSPRRDATSVFIRLEPLGDEAKRHRLLTALTEKTPQSKWFAAGRSDFTHIPGTPIAYWLSEKMRAAFTKGKPLGEVAEPRQGLATADNARFVREWWEVSLANSAFGCASRSEAMATGARWFPYNKGGAFRKWYGNQEHIVNWEDDGRELVAFKPRSVLRNTDYYFMPSVSWSDITSSSSAFRMFPPGFIHDVKGQSVFSHSEETRTGLISFLNSPVSHAMLGAVAPTISAQVGDVAILPVVPITAAETLARIKNFVAVSKMDWDDFETSWDFISNPLIEAGGGGAAGVARGSTRANAEAFAESEAGRAAPTGQPTLEQRVEAHRRLWEELSLRQQRLEEANNQAVAQLYGLEDEVQCAVPLERVSLTRNAAFRWPKQTEAERTASYKGEAVRELVSYAVGCMFGRYSVDQPGLILASQGETLEDYLAKVPGPSFMPDRDNVIPVTQGDWFEDDLAARFREFLKVAFGERHLQDNQAFVEQVLGKPIRQYFLKDFYSDHVHRYRNRPIYWLFSSRPDGKGAFNALVYIHRYTPATLSHLLNSYLREFQEKLRGTIAGLDRQADAAATKRADALRPAVTECEDYERNILYPLALRGPQIDLDDGVLVNYLRFGKAVQRIMAIEAKRSDVEKWTWPTNPLKPEDSV